MLPSLQQAELHPGDRMSLEEFLWRWERIPELKQAELIEGVVYLASPVSRVHGTYEGILSGWLNYYALTAGQNFEIGHNTTTLIGKSSLQPDIFLTRPTPGTKYLEKTPDLIIEICYSSRAYDLGPKLEAYRTAGLCDYLTVLLEEQRVEWRVLSGTRYRLLHQPKDGILRPAHFPALWLDTKALFPPDRKKLFGVVDQGVAAAK